MARRALLIATDDYLDEKLPNLKSPVSDMQLLAKVLTASHTQYEIDGTLEHPSIIDAMTAIDNFLGTRTSHDDLLLFLSGHGTVDQIDYYYLLKESKLGHELSSAVSGHFLRDALRRSRARSKTLIVDTCDSGSLADVLAGRKSSEERAGQLRRALAGTFSSTGVGTTVLASCLPRQESYERSTSGANAQTFSLFTSAVCYGLRTGEAARPELLSSVSTEMRITPHSLGDFARETLHRYFADFEPDDPSQQPSCFALPDHQSGGPLLANPMGPWIRSATGMETFFDHINRIGWRQIDANPVAPSSEPALSTLPTDSIRSNLSTLNSNEQPSADVLQHPAYDAENEFIGILQLVGPTFRKEPIELTTRGVRVRRVLAARLHQDIARARECSPAAAAAIAARACELRVFRKVSAHYEILSSQLEA